MILGFPMQQMGHLASVAALHIGHGTCWGVVQADKDWYWWRRGQNVLQQRTTCIRNAAAGDNPYNE